MLFRFITWYPVPGTIHGSADAGKFHGPEDIHLVSCTTFSAIHGLSMVFRDINILKPTIPVVV